VFGGKVVESALPAPCRFTLGVTVGAVTGHIVRLGDQRKGKAKCQNKAGTTTTTVKNLGPLPARPM
jgi:hypothetical protein